MSRNHLAVIHNAIYPFTRFKFDRGVCLEELTRVWNLVVFELLSKRYQIVRRIVRMWGGRDVGMTRWRCNNSLEARYKIKEETLCMADPSRVESAYSAVHTYTVVIPSWTRKCVKILMSKAHMVSLNCYRPHLIFKILLFEIFSKRQNNCLVSYC